MLSNIDSKDEKNKELEAYKRWHNSRFTKLWRADFEQRIEQLIKQDESLSATTEFEFNLKAVSNRIERKLLRDLIQKMDYKV